MTLLPRACPFRRRRGSTQVGPELMKARIAQVVQQCLLVLLRPQVVDGGGQFVEVCCQLVQVRP
jgi:hypothetical protein